MNEKDQKNLFDLISGLKSAEIENNEVQKEFCGALLQKYIDEGIDLYSLAPRSEIEDGINEGVALFIKRKKRTYIKRWIFSIFTGICCALFAYLYLLLNISQALMFFLIGTLGDYIFKIKLNKIAFVVEARREYVRKVDKNLVNIRKSEDVTKLWS